MAEFKAIVAFDGEGIESRYVLLAASNDQALKRRSGLHAGECLDFLSRDCYRKTLNLWYSFDYDVNMILRGRGDRDFWQGRRAIRTPRHEVRYFPHKILKIKTSKGVVTHYDLFGFFQTSFVQALQDWLRVDDETIQEGKKARHDFTRWTMKQIEEYNRHELIHLVALGEKVREIFDTLDIPLKMKSWHGAGAGAQAALSYAKISPELEADPRIEELATLAYYGGRVETLQRGSFSNVLRYDLKSAYPSAMLRLPRLNECQWKPARVIHPKRIGIYHIQFEGFTERVCPFPIRLSNGLIIFPFRGEGWYWGYEALAASQAGFPLKVLEGWTVSNSPPLSRLEGLVNTLYDLRKVYRQQNDSREKAVKLILNALYGKLAQKEGGRFHSLIYAGLITSYTRGLIFQAVQQRPDDVISIATDGIVTRAPLVLPLGADLGNWEVETGQRLEMVMNGVYRFETSKRVECKTRGFHLDPQDFDEVYDSLIHEGRYFLESRRFVTNILQLCFHDHYPKPCQWVIDRREINPEHDLKRAWGGRFTGKPQTSSPLLGYHVSLPYIPQKSIELEPLDVDDI